MTSTAKLDLYEHANTLNCTLADVQSTGKHWRGEIRDALHPSRPTGRFGPGDFAMCKGTITAYCDRRQAWVQGNPTLFGMLERRGPDDKTEPQVQVLEIPGGYTQDDLDAAVNEAIQELMQNMGTLQPLPVAELLTTEAERARAEELDKTQRDRDYWMTVAKSTRKDLGDADGLNKQLKEQIQKRDAVILTLREDFTKLLAESQARNLRLFGMYDEIIARVNEHTRNIVADAKRTLVAGPTLDERRVIDDRVKGCLEAVTKTLAASGLAVDGGAIVTQEGA